MRKKENKYCYYLYILLILLTLYTDSPLSIYLGALGDSVLYVVSLILCPLMWMSGGIIISDTFIKKFAFLVKWTVAVSIISIVVCLFIDVSYYQMGEFLPLKAIKGLFPFLGYLFYLLILTNIGRELTIEQIFKPFFYGFLSLTLVLLLEMIQLPKAFPYLHYLSPTSIYYRVRLLTPEASGTVVMLEIFFALALYYCHYIKSSKLFTFIVIGCAAIQIFMSGSKLLLATLCLAYVIINLNSIKLLFTLKGGIIALVTLYFLSKVLLPILEASIMMDIEQSTSVVTRTYTSFLGYAIGICFPLGTGFQTYLAILPKVMKDYLWIIDEVSPVFLNLDEIIAYIMRRDMIAGLTAKSFFAQSSMYWGIVGTIYLIRVIYELYKCSIEKYKVKGGLIFKGLVIVLIIQFAFTSNMDFSFLAFCYVMIYLKKYNLLLITAKKHDYT